MTSPTDIPPAAERRLFPFARKPSFVRAANLFALAFLYLAGVVHWAAFFKYGDMSFRSEDWPKERLYVQVFRDAIHNGQVPYHIGVSPYYVDHFPQFDNYGPREETRLIASRYLALPETVLSPQIVLLRWLKPNRFVLAHIL